LGAPSPSFWENAAGFVGAPIAVWITTVGLGLLVERLVRARLANALLVPLGYCLAVVVCLGVYTLKLGNDVLLPVLLVLVASGLLLARGELPGRLNGGWPLLAGACAYVLFDLGAIATGHWTFAGYKLQDDVAYELLLARHMQTYGATLGSVPPSTATSFIGSFLSTGYPLGTQAYLGALGGMLNTELAAIWQGYLSALAGVGAIAASLLTTRTLSRPVGALVGLLAMAAALTYQYAMQGAIKEIGVTVAVLCALALISQAIITLKGLGAAVIVAIPLAAILATYNAAGLPYATGLAGTGLLATLYFHYGLRLRAWLPRRSWLGPGAMGLVVFFVLAWPALKTVRTFFNVAKGLYSAGNGNPLPLGQLLRPLPVSEVVGVWLNGDYRVPVAPGISGTVELLATVLILALGALGVVHALRRREPAPLMGVATMGAALLIVYPRAIPYAQAKLLAIASPVAVLGAAVGVAALASGLRRWRLRPLAPMLGAALAAAVLFSDALAYHHDPIAPTSRLLAVRQVGRYLGDRGPVLDSEFDEFAKYFALPARLYVGSEYPTPRNLELINPGGLYGHSFDLDRETLAFVESYPYILVRRSPVASRPPVNFTRVYENYFYEVWRRDTSPHVLAHVPLQERYSGYAKVPCAVLATLVRGAAPASRLVVAESPETVGYEVLRATVRSPGWIENFNPYTPDTVLPLTPGAAGKVVYVPRRGTYRVWVQGSFPRPIRVSLDGRTVGSVDGQNTADEWLPAGIVHINAGHHALDLFRSGGSLRPGDGGTGSVEGKGEIGAVTLAAQEPERLRSVALSSWRSLCGRNADWVEVVAAS